MPGSNGYNAAQQTEQSKTFLDEWYTVFGGNEAPSHMALDAVDENMGCLVCHSPNAVILGGAATDFTAFAIGTDLANDHPVGITRPSTPDFNTPTGTAVGINWFDNDGDSRPDSDDIRLYDTGSGPRVECASCHDPHGVSPGGFGGTINPSFLRISNSGSAVCLTCHVK